jgi:hypothetical protein
MAGFVRAALDVVPLWRMACRLSARVKQKYRDLQVISEWRDPDSNRGHHDFQLCGLRLRLLLVALQSAFLSQITQYEVVGCSPMFMTGWYTHWCNPD